MNNFRHIRRFLAAVIVLCKVAAAVAETGLEPIQPEFKLSDGAWERYAPRVARWEGSHRRVALRDVLAALDRQAKEDCWEGGGPDSKRRGVFSFCWKDVPHSANDDEDGRYWYPQGIAASAEADWSGVPARQRTLVVTWYRRKDKDASSPATATRISIVDATDRRRVRYRHVPLVGPECRACDEWKTLSIHAGGVAWRGRYLYVADTDRGLRVFDLSRFLRAGEGFVLPQVAFYEEVRGTYLDYSFVSVAPDGTLLTGEYRDGKDGARLVHWPLKDDGRLKTSGGRVHAARAFKTRGELRNLQGAAVMGGNYYLVRSHGKRAGELFVGRPGGSFRSYDDWAIGPEDLSTGAGGWLWNLTEHPGEGRSVFAARF